MKTAVLLLFFSLCIIHVLNAQVDSTTLDHNNVSTHISDAGTYFYDFTNQTKGYEVPKGSDRHAIHTTQFWFAGKDASNEIRFIQGGMPNEGSDVFNGPISDPGTYNTTEYQEEWGNSIGSICQSDIDKYLTNFECAMDPDCTDEPIPISNDALLNMINWPAHGNPTDGQGFYLAPFYDYPSEGGTGDGIYDPSQGDHPIIKGCCAVYMIQNDAAETHSYTFTDSMGIELHIMFYQYRTWDYLNDVTFIDITAINRGNTDYTDFMHSIVVDAEIGNKTDDYFGSDSLNNTMFFYNADNNDEDGTTDLGYGVDPPAIGVVGLKENMTSCVPLTNDAINVSSKWNLMKGLKENGDPWLDPNSNETKYVFSGNPNTASEWSALSAGAPTGEAKGILSIDYGDFNSGDTLKQSYAITYARDGDNLDNVQSIIDMASVVKSFYENESDIPCSEGTWNLEELNKLDVTIFPNPSSGIVNLNNHDKMPISLTVYDPHGKIIEERNSSNESSIEIDLSNQRSGVYFMHIKTQKESTVKKIVIN